MSVLTGTGCSDYSTCIVKCYDKMFLDFATLSVEIYFKSKLTEFIEIINKNVGSELKI